MRKLEKCHKKIHDQFKDRVDDAFKKKFNLELVTYWNFCEMRLMSARADEQPLTDDQRSFINGYSNGYAAAMEQVCEEQ